MYLINTEKMTVSRDDQQKNFYLSASWLVHESTLCSFSLFGASGAAGGCAPPAGSFGTYTMMKHTFENNIKII